MLRYTEVAKTLTREYEEKGYTCRLENDGHKHPRFYIGVNGQERFTIMSSTANYDQGNLISMMRQDIERDIIPLLPKPTLPTEAKPKPDPLKDIIDKMEPEDNRVFGIKAFIMGRGVFAIQIPKEAIPLGKQKASPMLLGSDSKRLCLLFTAKDGADPKPSKSPDRVIYHFGRQAVPFKYAENSVPGFKSPELCARFHGGSLVCDEPLPPEILYGKTLMYKKGDKPSIEEGKQLREMLNEWIEAAERDGLDPKISVEKNRISIQIAVTIKQEL